MNLRIRTLTSSVNDKNQLLELLSSRKYIIHDVPLDSKLGNIIYKTYEHLARNKMHQFLGSFNNDKLIGIIRHWNTKLIPHNDLIWSNALLNPDYHWDTEGGINDLLEYYWENTEFRYIYFTANKSVWDMLKLNDNFIHDTEYVMPKKLKNRIAAFYIKNYTKEKLKNIMWGRFSIKKLLL